MRSEPGSNRGSYLGTENRVNSDEIILKARITENIGSIDHLDTRYRPRAQKRSTTQCKSWFETEETRGLERAERAFLRGDTRATERRYMKEPMTQPILRTNECMVNAPHTNGVPSSRRRRYAHKSAWDRQSISRDRSSIGKHSSSDI